MREHINKSIDHSLNESSEKKTEYVIVDMTSGSKYPFYDKQSNSFFQELPLATFFKSLDRAEMVLISTQKKHPDKKLEIKNVDDVDGFMWRNSETAQPSAMRYLKKWFSFGKK
jgi:hypothetical protein